MKIVAAALAAASIFATATSAQTVAGLPDSGLFLSGDPAAPALRNTASRRLIVYAVRFSVLRAGAPHTITRSFSGLLAIRNSLPGEALIPPGGERRIPMDGAAGDIIQDVSLDTAIFEDGEVVGPDRSGTSDFIAARIQAERDLHEMVITSVAQGKDRTQLWATVRQLGTVGPPDSKLPQDFHLKVGQARPGRVPYMPSDMERYAREYQWQRQIYAEELSNVQARAGEARALDLARSSAVYPGLWRRQVK